MIKHPPGAIHTYTGVVFEPLSPSLSSIKIEDIAHALSNICRYTGHTKEFYSVAQHSVYVAKLLKKWGHDKEVQFQGFSHDFSEAYLTDLPRPLKAHESFEEAYRIAEARLMGVINQKFGVEWQHSAVKKADNALLCAEIRDLMKQGREWETYDPLIAKEWPKPIRCWRPKTAKSHFMRTFKELYSD